MSEHWLPISVTSEATIEKIEHTLEACFKAYTWTFAVLKEQWVKTLEIPNDRSIRRNLTKYIYMNKLLHHAQRYTLNRAAEKAAAEFRLGLRVVGDNFIEFVEPVPFVEYTDFSIQSREVWRKYLTKYDSISTTYGMLTLPENWREIFTELSDEMRVEVSYLPYLWHSATIRAQGSKHLLKFNFHGKTSALGRKAKQRVKLQESNEWQTWTYFQEEKLVDLRLQGQSFDEIGVYLGRTANGVEKRYREILGHSKKKELSQKMIEINKKARRNA